MTTTGHVLSVAVGAAAMVTFRLPVRRTTKYPGGSNAIASTAKILLNPLAQTRDSASVRKSGSKRHAQS